MNISITKKITLVFTLVCLIIGGLLGYTIYQGSSSRLIQYTLNDLENKGKVNELLINNYIAKLEHDISFIAGTPPVQGLIRARKNAGIDPQDGSSQEEWEKRLQMIFSQFLHHNPQYFQVRYIGVAENGLEIIRTEKKNKQILNIEAKNLQQKGNSEYFRKTVTLQRGEMYLSEINLNYEHGKVSVPHIKTLRIATPIFSDEKVFGIIVINVNIAGLFDAIQTASSAPTELYLTNAKGEFLIHPDPSKVFAFDLTPGINETHILPEDGRSLPELANELQKSNLTSRVSDQNVFHAKKIILGSSSEKRTLFLGLAIPKKAAFADVDKLRRESGSLALLLLSIGTLIIALLARRITVPLRVIAQKIVFFDERKGALSFPKNYTSEIGILAKSFEIMTERIVEGNQLLRDQENHIRSIMETALDSIIIIGESGRIISINTAFEKLFGYLREEVIGQNVNMIVPSPNKEKHNEHIENYLKTGKKKVIGSTCEVEGLHKDGHLIPISISVSEFNDGEKRYFTGIIHDIRERKAAEEALLKAHKELLKQANSLRLAGEVFANTSEGIVITDENNQIVNLNKSHSKITGYSKEELLGKDPKRMKSGRHNADFYKEMWNSINDSGEWSGEIWDRRKNGEIFPKWLSINTVKDDNGKIVNYIGIFNDISAIKKAEEDLRQLAYYDSLTGLPNRIMFRETIHNALELAKRNDWFMAVLYLDLDHFKYVNDSLGHLAGDQLLCEVSERLNDAVRESDTVARLGGDEFAIVLPRIHHEEDTSVVSQKIIDSLTQAFTLLEKEVFINTSIGISIYPDDGDTVETLVKHADTAMYSSKERGKGCYTFFSKGMNEKAAHRLFLDTNLRKAITNNEFTVYYQPQIDFKTSKMIGMEALVRWEHPERGLISPAEFIPFAEETGLIIPLGEFVLREACMQNKKWQNEGLPAIPVAVNLSARQFKDAHLLEKIDGILRETGLPPEFLDLELTESLAMENAEGTIEILKELNKRGIKTSIDDFGTGYSSLSYLKSFPVEKLKLDQSFVSDLPTNADDRSIANAIIQLAHSMNLKVVAEGIETREQQGILHEFNCNIAQGYLYSKPIPASELYKKLKKGQLGPETI